MNGNGRSRVQDLKTLALIITITGGLAGLAVSVVSWAQTRVSTTDAQDAHKAIHQRVSKVDNKATDNTHAIEQAHQTIGRDVKTIKCILTAPNRKAKANCALGD